jgi:acetylxylan esterase
MKYHLDYFDKWGEEVASWVVDRARSASTIPGDSEEKSGASGMVNKGIAHPVANVFLFLFVLFCL